jgi:stage II sporulation protein D
MPSGANSLPSSPVVRVRLLQNVSQVSLSATRPPTVRTAAGSAHQLALTGGAAVPVRLVPGGWQIGSATLPAGELTIDPESDGTASVNGQAYRGSYHLVPSAPFTFDVVNHVGIDPYLKGVVAKELYPQFQPEAYKAQAIVARTYALYEWKTAPAGRSWDLFADTRSQVYGGMAGESAKSRAAVDDTAGVVVAFGPPGQERIFKTYYTSCCGGISQSARQAFGDADLEPLHDQFIGGRCAQSSRFNWGPIVISRDELTRRFRIWGANHGRPEKSIATIKQIEIAKLNGSGRPVQFTVTDARGLRYLLSGEELRMAVNTDAQEPAPPRGAMSAPPTNTLPSSYVSPVADGPNIRFEQGHGFGHGVGLCQWCAQSEAQAGVPAEKIVLSAFPGAKLVRAY